MEASDYTTTESPSANGSTQSQWTAHESGSPSSGHPEYPVVAAFFGAFAFAKLLKAIGGGDDD